MFALVRKDLLIELRTREMTSSLLLLGVLVLLVQSFAFDPASPPGRAAAPGVLWVAVIFSGLLGISRSWLRETENGCLSGLLIAPVDRGTIFLSKVIANLFILGAAQCIVLPAFVVFFNRPFLETCVRLAPILVLGILGFAAIATFFAAIALRTRAREVMLPLLMLPLATPLFLACVEATRTAFEPSGSVENPPWLSMLVAFDVIFLVVGWLGLDYVVEE